jgi:hypothetical protein
MMMIWERATAETDSRTHLHATLEQFKTLSQSGARCEICARAATGVHDSHKLCADPGCRERVVADSAINDYRHRRAMRRNTQ